MNNREDYIREYEDSTFANLFEGKGIDHIVRENIKRNGNSGVCGDQQDIHTYFSETIQYILDELDTNGDMLDDLQNSLENDIAKARMWSSEHDNIPELQKLVKQKERDLACIIDAPDSVVYAYHQYWVMGVRSEAEAKYLQSI